MSILIHLLGIMVCIDLMIGDTPFYAFAIMATLVAIYDILKK